MPARPLRHGKARQVLRQAGRVPVVPLAVGWGAGGLVLLAPRRLARDST